MADERTPLPKLVPVQRPDGSVVLVPEFAVARQERTTRETGVEGDILEFLTRDPLEEFRPPQISSREINIEDRRRLLRRGAEGPQPGDDLRIGTSLGSGVLSSAMIYAP